MPTVTSNLVTLLISNQKPLNFMPSPGIYLAKSWYEITLSRKFDVSIVTICWKRQLEIKYKYELFPLRYSVLRSLHNIVMNLQELPN